MAERLDQAAIDNLLAMAGGGTQRRDHCHAGGIASLRLQHDLADAGAGAAQVLVWEAGGLPGGLYLARAVGACNEAAVGPEGMLIGDTVDVALAEFARSAGEGAGEGNACALIDRLPYEPVNRFSAALVRDGEGEAIYAKGAPEAILPMCGPVPPELVDRVTRPFGNSTMQNRSSGLVSTGAVVRPHDRLP